MQMPGPWGNLGLYKSRPASLGPFAKPRELPRGEGAAVLLLDVSVRAGDVSVGITVFPVG